MKNRYKDTDYKAVKSGLKRFLANLSMVYKPAGRCIPRPIAKDAGGLK